VARAETAQGEAVPLRATGFTRGNTDAGNIAQRIPQGIRLLLIHDLSWDDGDRLGNVLNRLGQTLQSEVGNDVGTLLFGDCHLGHADLSFFFGSGPRGSAADPFVANANLKAHARPAPSPAARAIFWRILFLRLSLARFSCRLMVSSKVNLSLAGM